MNKKRNLVIGFLVVLMTTSLFAANTYVVESVTGKVTYEAAPGNWKDVAVGQELTDATVINTGMNSSLVVSLNGSNVTIKSMQKGALNGLASAGAVKGLKKGPSVAKDTTADATKTQKGVVTASSRASEAKEDLEWDEE